MKLKQNTHAVSKYFFSLEKPDNYRNKTKEKCNKVTKLLIWMKNTMSLSPKST